MSNRLFGLGLLGVYAVWAILMTLALPVVACPVAPTPGEPCPTIFSIQTFILIYLPGIILLGLFTIIYVTHRR